MPGMQKTLGIRSEIAIFPGVPYKTLAQTLFSVQLFIKIIAFVASFLLQIYYSI